MALDLAPEKPPVIHGRDGISRKARGEGRASHYISLTRLAASGSLEAGGQREQVTGLAWMDHEFFTHQIAPEQTGWDWLSIQLENRTELMLFRLRRKDGAPDPYSSGTWVDAAGAGRHLDAGDFRLTPGRLWRSSATGAAYPISWKIEVFPLNLELEATTPLESQEMVSQSRWSPTYWEGAMDYRGRAGTTPVRGAGYLEMSGYDRAVRLPD
jgi:predicted secreted hydrolase